jgi:hypothetical protein
MSGRPTRPAARDDALARIVIAIAAAAVAIALSQHLGYSPMWDGRIYADCFAAAASDPRPGSFRCAGHASHAYVALVALIESVSPGSEPLLIAANAGLLLLAWIGFHRLLGLTFPAADQRLDRALLGAVFVMQPALVAGVVQPGLDLPIVPAFIWTVVFLLQRRFSAAAAVGYGLVFTKETGVLLYGVLLAVYAIWRMRTHGLRIHKPEWISAAPRLLLPLAIFGAYLAYRAALPGEPVIWSGNTVGQSLVAQFLIPSVDLYQVNYAALILVLSFGWITTILVAGDGLVGCFRALQRKQARALPGVDAQRLWFLVVLLIATGYALTRFITFGNPRYFLVPRILLLVIAFAALLRLGSSPSVRRAVLAVAAALTLVSAVRTIDPVSRGLFGTFTVGERSMLRMTSITGECCGYGRDQLVYNLEFAWLQRAMQNAVRFAAASGPNPGDSLLFAVPDSALGTLTPAWLREPNATGTQPTLITVPHSRLVTGIMRPDSLTLIALPLVDYSRALRELATVYVVAPPKVFDAHGYRVSTYRLTRRPAGL